MKMPFKAIQTLTITCLCTFGTGCSKKSTTTAAVTTTSTTTATTTSTTTSTTNATTKNAFPSTLAITSALASTTTTSGMPKSPIITKNKNGYTSKSFNTGISYADKKAVLATVLAAATDSACQITLPSITNSNGPSCYGPDLDYSNHIDATATDSDDTATTAMSNTSDDGRLPTGDLGIMTSTHTTTGEACTAAKMNSLMSNVTDKIDSAVLLAASVNCVAQRTSTSLPAIGATVTLTTNVNTAIAVNNTNTTITLATISRLDDISSKAVYVYTIYGTNTSGMSFQYAIKHKQNETDGSQYIGKVYASIEGLNSGTSDSFAYSLLYEQTATDLNYQMLAAGYNKSTSSPHPTTLFNSSKDLDITNTAFNGNYTQTLASITSSTGYGDMSFAWQAGSNDRATRVFNVFTNATQGCGFFGYGDKFNVSTGALPDNAITKFICNWAGPGNTSSADVTLKAQKQCMTLSSGKYVVDSTKENISYSPNNTCSFNGTSSNSSARKYNWGIASSTGPSDFSTFGAAYTMGSSHSAVTNNLITISSDTDYLTYSAPSAPVDPF